MEYTYEIYRGLKNLQACRIFKRLHNNHIQFLQDEEIVKQVLEADDEVFFELESNDLWIQVAFQLFHLDELYIYGMTEVKVDKAEKLEDLKKKL